MEPVWQALQESGFAAAIRNSTFIYPIANVVHVVGVVAFFGIVAAMDLRLLKVLKGEPAALAVRRLRPIAVALLAIVVAAGFILFSAEALQLARNPAFWLKIGAVVIALVNVVVSTLLLRAHGEGGAAVRLTAAVSLTLWLAAAALGRSIAYV